MPTGPDPKNEHFQRLVLTPTGVTPGTYASAIVAVNDEGLITNIASSSTTANFVVADPGSLPSAPPATSGATALVLDNGDGTPAVYVFDGVSWFQVSVDPAGTVRYRQEAINTTATQALGDTIGTNSIVKRVSLTITTAFSGGATIRVENTAGVIYMPTSSNNPQLLGTYEVELPSNNTAVGANDQLRVVVGGVPASGAGIVSVEFYKPN